ncbi:NDR1/HIN1-like protein 10 [Lotus japonicus]|uniref:NDR1/HIN1-like protein 10 n=1 Tax=Lotus japonicus TaxID=34305 RepID=UPI00258E2F4F|nr:NDR1/HIN1-like protein 10 [Lotus japonicus]
MQYQDPSRPVTGYPAPQFHHPNGGHQQPPPPSAAYPYQYYNNPRPYARRSFLRAFFATIVCLAVVSGCILIITWLVLRPTLPHFTLTSLSVTNFSLTSQSITATCNLAFLVRNGNKKMSVTYNGLRSSLFYRSDYITENNLAPFKQDTKSQTTLNATFSAAGAYIGTRAVDSINADRSGGSVPLDVQILASASFRSGKWRFRTRWLKVLCRKLPVSIKSNSTSGDLIGGSRECQVWT